MKRNLNRITVVLTAMCVVLCGCTKTESGRRQGAPSIICNVMGVETRGTTISTDGSVSHSTTTGSIKTGGFVLNAYAEGEYYFNEYPAEQQGSSAKPHSAGLYFTKSVTHSTDHGWTITDEPRWIDNLPITFWSWNTAAAGVIGTPVCIYGENGTLTFSYSLPASTASTEPAASQVDATNQQDIVFAYNREKRAFNDDGSFYASGCEGTGTDEKMDIHFYHALSEVLFAVSPDDGTFDRNIEIKSICIKNVYSKGSCTIIGSKLPYESPTDPSEGFAWSYGEDTQTHNYAQDYNADFSAFNSDSPQDFLPERADATEGQDSWHHGTYSDASTSPATTRSIYSSNNKFFMIPQTLPSTAVLSVTFDNGGTVTTQDAPIYDSANTGANVWKAGYYYKYKICYHDSGAGLRFSVQLVDWYAKDVNIEI